MPLLNQDEWEVVVPPKKRREDEWEVVSPARKPETAGFGETTKAALAGIYGAAADVLPKTVAEAYRGGDVPLESEGYTDRVIEEQKRDIESRRLRPEVARKSVPFTGGKLSLQDLKGGLENLGYSGATAIGGMAAGAAAASPIPVPGARIVGGAVGAGALSGATAYRATKDQFVADILDKIKRAPGLTEEKWQEVKTAIEDDAELYGLWEAAPEAVGNALTAGIIKLPVGRVLKNVPAIKSGIARALASAGIKSVSAFGEEIPTEALTAYKQSEIEERHGLGEKYESYGAAMEDIAGQTAVTTLATLGLGSAVSRQRPSQQAEDALNDPSVDIETRKRAGREVAAKLAQYDPEYAQEWTQLAADAIANGEAIPSPFSPWRDTKEILSDETLSADEKITELASQDPLTLVNALEPATGPPSTAQEAAETFEEQEPTQAMQEAEQQAQRREDAAAALSQAPDLYGERLRALRGKERGLAETRRTQEELMNLVNQEQPVAEEQAVPEEIQEETEAPVEVPETPREVPEAEVAEQQPRFEDVEQPSGAVERNAPNEESKPVSFRDREHAELLQQAAEDQIETRKQYRREVPQRLFDIVAAAKEYLDDGNVTEGVASQEVFGHPLATNIYPDKYGNLVPIKVSGRDSVERKIEHAQSLLDDIQRDVAETEYKASRGDKKAKQKVETASFDEKKAIRDLLREETMPELGRLLKQFPETPTAGLPSVDTVTGPSAEAAPAGEASPEYIADENISEPNQEVPTPVIKKHAGGRLYLDGDVSPEQRERLASIKGVSVSKGTGKLPKGTVTFPQKLKSRVEDMLNDRKEEGRIPRGERVGEESRRPVQEQGTGEETVTDGGVLQTEGQPEEDGGALFSVAKSRGNARGQQKLRLFHGTNETTKLPNVVKPGNKEAKAQLADMAARFNISDTFDLANILERWQRMGMLDERGATDSDVKLARQWTEASKDEIEHGSVVPSFPRFKISENSNELGVHFGTQQQAETRGTAFEYEVSINNPIELPDLGVWSPENVINALEKAGVRITSRDKKKIGSAKDKTKTLREILLSKGYDGIVYENESEGPGKSYIALSEDQITLADAPKDPNASEDTLFSVAAPSRLEEQTFEKYGTTDTPRDSGYVGTDGKFLNMNPARKPGGRYLAHATVARRMGAANEVNFMRDTGMIRFDADANVVEINGRMPTREQVNALEDIFGGDNVTVEADFSESRNRTSAPEHRGEIANFTSAKLTGWLNRAAGGQAPAQMYSTGQKTGTKTDQVAREVERSLLGRTGYRNLTKSGKLNIVQSVAELPEAGTPLMDGNNIAGVYKDGKVHLVADNIQEGKAADVMRHEGLHLLIRNDKTFRQKKADLLKQMETLRKSNRAVQDAFNRVPAGTNPDSVTEEALAYLVESNPNHSVARRLIAAVKAWLFRHGIRIRNLTDADMVALATQGIRSYARNQEGGGINEFAQPVMTSLRKAKKSITDNPAFRRWFEDSKGIDGNGQPHVFYHGTVEDFEVFDKRLTGSETLAKDAKGVFFFTSNSNVAEDFAGYQYTSKDGKTVDKTYYSGANIKPVYLNIKNPLVWDMFGGSYSEDFMKDAIAEAKKDGYDSIVFLNMKDGSVSTVGPWKTSHIVAVFSPTQIKSIYNTGAFDPNNPDIRFSTTEAAKAPMFRKRDAFDDIPTKIDEDSRRERVVDDTREMFTTFRQKMQDKFIDLKELQREIEDAYKAKIPDESNFYQKVWRYQAKTKNRLDKFAEERVKPIMDEITKGNVNVTRLGKFLHARHVLLDDVNEKLKEMQPEGKKSDALSGMTDAEARRIVKEHENDPHYKEIAQQIDRLNRDRLKLAVDAGLLSSDEAQAWRERWSHYVPLHREEAEAENIVPPRGRGFQVPSKLSQRRLGSVREVDHQHMLAHLVGQYENTIIRAQKNEVGQSLLNLLESYPAEGFATVDEPLTKRAAVKVWSVYSGDEVVHNSRTKKDAKEWARKNGYDPVDDVARREEVRTTGDPMAKYRDNVVVVKKNGEERHIVFSEKNPRAVRFAKSYKNLGTERMNLAVKTLSTVNRALSSVNTSLNPEFFLSNFARDVQTAIYNISDADIKGLRRKLIKNIPQALRGVRDGLRGAGNTEWGKIYKQFEEDGGKTGWIDAHGDIKKRASQLNKDIEMMRGKRKARQLVKTLGKFVDDYNAVFENATRLASYKAALDGGATREQAANLAKNLTVNFEIKGDYGTVMNALYLFYNASIQGNARMLSAILRSKNTRKMVAGTVVLAALLDMVNRSAGGEDDDGTPLYDALPDYEKERNIIIMPKAFGLDLEEPIKIPAPWGYNVIHVLGQGVGEVFTRDDNTVVESGGRVLSALIEAFSPVGGTGSVAQFLSPTITDPVIQIAENKTFSGNPLRPEQPTYGREKPEYQMYWKSASGFSQALAKWLNDHTGGDAVKPGAVNISPEALDLLLIEVPLGGIGRAFGYATETGRRIAQGEDLKSTKIPFARKVYGTDYDRSRKSRFYEQLDEVLLVKDRIEHYKRDPRRVARIRRENRAEASLIPLANATSKQMARLRKLKRRAEDRGRPTEAIESRMKALMDRFNAAYARRKK